MCIRDRFSDFYSAVIIRQGLFSPSVQPLFGLVLKLHGLAMSGLAISASPFSAKIANFYIPNSSKFGTVSFGLLERRPWGS